MSLTGEAVNELYHKFADPVVVAGRTYLPDGWKEADPPKKHHVQPLQIGTLTGLIDYIKARTGQDHEAPLDTCLLHIVSPNIVRLLGPLEDEDEQFRRQVYMEATTTLVEKPFAFGNFIDSETFVIALQSLFVKTADSDQLLSLVSHIRESTVKTTQDHGATQEVVASQGVLLAERKEIPNPVKLQPYRTFREIEQPASLFVVRARAGVAPALPTVALFEADGGSWKLEAIERIRTWLKADVRALTIPIIG